MAQEQGGQGGRVYGEEDVQMLLDETARRAAAEALKHARPKRREDDYEDEDELNVVNPKVVKQLRDTVSIFTTLKEFSTNPLQQAIEKKVGDLAATVVENAFTQPRGPPPKRDIVDTILNSQFAFGLGSGLGQRAPELVESMSKNFGRDKAEQFIDAAISSYGRGQGGQGGSRQLGSGPSGPSPSPSHTVEQKVEKQQTEKELLLSLDPNNPEHVAAYAESQGGLPVETARKMLMIHQDAFIEQMRKQGADISQISTMRGSHAEKQQQTIQQPVQRQQVQSVDTPMTYTAPKQQEIEYTEFQDVSQGSINSMQQPPVSPIDNQQTQQDIIKQFTDDIGKVMEGMIEKIETLNNVVFSLQNELNTVKGQRVTPSQKVLAEKVDKTMEEIMELPKRTTRPTIQKSEDFFEENVQSIDTFQAELEEEAKAATKAFEKQLLSSNLQTPVSTSQPNVPRMLTETIPKTTVQTTVPIDISKAEDNTTDENKITDEKKKFVTPIKRDIHKNIVPSFKTGLQPKRDEDI